MTSTEPDMTYEPLFPEIGPEDKIKSQIFNGTEGYIEMAYVSKQTGELTIVSKTVMTEEELEKGYIMKCSYAGNLVKVTIHTSTGTSVAAYSFKNSTCVIDNVHNIGCTTHFGF